MISPDDGACVGTAPGAVAAGAGEVGVLAEPATALAAAVAVAAAAVELTREPVFVPDSKATAALAPPITMIPTIARTTLLLNILSPRVTAYPPELPIVGPNLSKMLP